MMIAVIFDPERIDIAPNRVPPTTEHRGENDSTKRVVKTWQEPQRVIMGALLE
jgi:hypothetical protein